MNALKRWMYNKTLKQNQSKENLDGTMLKARVNELYRQFLNSNKIDGTIYGVPIASKARRHNKSISPKMIAIKAAEQQVKSLITYRPSIKTMQSRVYQRLSAKARELGVANNTEHPVNDLIQFHINQARAETSLQSNKKPF